jgi:hypothetical protein
MSLAVKKEDSVIPSYALTNSQTAADVALSHSYRVGLSSLMCSSHPEQPTCLRQVEGEMTPAIAMDARPGGPITKRQPSPEGLGSESQRGSQRRRRGTKPIVRPDCVIGSYGLVTRRSDA